MDISVPDLGDFADVEVIEVLVQVGDRIEPEDPLVTLETDKATMDVPSTAGGSVVEIKVAVGDRVSTGDVIVVLDGEGQSEHAAEAGQPDEAEDVAAQGRSEAAGASGGARSAGAEEASAAAREAGAVPSKRGGVRPRSVRVPDLGDFDAVEIIDVLVAEGDEVEAEQGLITLETDKATMDVPTPVAGRVLEMLVEAGGTVNPGDAVARIEPRAGARAKPAKKPAPDDAQAEPDAAPPAKAAPPAAKASAVSTERQATALPAVGIVDEAAFSRAHASPSVRKLARELGVDLGRVAGTGQKGRVTAEDVKSFVKRVITEGVPGPALPKVPEVDFSKFGKIETVKLTRIQKISGPRLKASWINLPHVTQHDDADITELEAKRQALKDDAAKKGIKLTPLAFIMRAAVLTLQEFPHFRSSLGADDASLVVKHYYHLGFAADTPNGLVVPVIRDADRKDLFELAAALGEQSAKAREGKLGADDVQGAVFTISSLGGIGGSYFTPIINAPEVAILGVSRSRMQPVFDGTVFVPRLMLPLSLSYDHRVIDGAHAARFITHLSEALGQVDRLVAAIP